MKTKRLPSLLLCSLLTGLTPAFAALVVSDNFNTYSDGVLPSGTTGGGYTWGPAGGTATFDNGTDLFTRVTTDSGNLFGQGTANKYLRIADTSNANNGANYNLPVNKVSYGEVGTIALNFYDPSGDGGQGNGWLMRIGIDAGNGNAAFGLFLMNGQLRVATTANVEPASSAFATYSLDALHSLAIVFNSSASAIEYAGRSLAAGKMDVWLDGSIVGTALDGAGGLAGSVQTIQSVNFTRKVSASTALDFVGTLYLDDLAVYSGVETSLIPEPSSVALLGGLGMMFAALLRRRR